MGGWMNFRMRWIGLGIVVWLAGGRGVEAQAMGGRSVDELLGEVRAAAEVYDAKAPSVSCHESIVMDEMKHGAVKRETRVEGTIRVMRVAHAKTPLAESHEFLTRNGEAVKEQRFNMSYWVVGGFANGLGHSLETLRPCLDARAEKAEAGWRLELAWKPGAEAQEACRQPAVPGYRKTLLLDEAGHVLHVERTMPADVAKKLGEASFAAVDFAPVVLGSQTVWLPARLESHDGKDENRLEVRYSGCRLFGGSMTILPGAEKVPEP